MKGRARGLLADLAVIVAGLDGDGGDHCELAGILPAALPDGWLVGLN
ncbi:hypothetical protein [Methylobacterium sp. CM6247]